MNKQVAIKELEYTKIKLEEAKEANIFVSPNTDIAIDMAIEALQDDWIPVSDDTLPKDARPVLVYAWNVHHVVGQYKNMRTDDGEYEDMWITASAYEAPRRIENVIAWKPLSEPYKGGDTE